MHAFLLGFRFFIPLFLCVYFHLLSVFIFISFLVCSESEKEMGRDRSPKDPGRSSSLNEVEGMFSVCCFEISRDYSHKQDCRTVQPPRRLQDCTAPTHRLQDCADLTHRLQKCAPPNLPDCAAPHTQTAGLCSPRRKNCRTVQPLTHRLPKCAAQAPRLPDCADPTHKLQDCEAPIHRLQDCPAFTHRLPNCGAPSR